MSVLFFIKLGCGVGETVVLLGRCTCMQPGFPHPLLPAGCGLDFNTLAKWQWSRGAGCAARALRRRGPWLHSRAALRSGEFSRRS